MSEIRVDLCPRCDGMFVEKRHELLQVWPLAGTLDDDDYPLEGDVTTESEWTVVCVYGHSFPLVSYGSVRPRFVVRVPESVAGKAGRRA